MNVATPTTPTDSPRLNLTNPKDRPPPASAPSLSEADVEAVRKALSKGMSGYARQGDIIELHKRIGERFESLPARMHDLDKSNHDSILARVDQLNGTLNSLEAAVRIELAPLLSDVIAQAVAGGTRRPRRLATLLALVCALVAGMAVGVLFQEPLADWSAQAQGAVERLLNFRPGT